MSHSTVIVVSVIDEIIRPVGVSGVAKVVTLIGAASADFPALVCEETETS